MSNNPSPGEIVYTIQKIYGAQLNTQTNTYGIPFVIDYVQDGEISGEYDTDEIKAGGMWRELLTVQVGSMVKFSEAWMPAAAVTALTNEVETLSGASGNRVWSRVSSGAGEGLPYVGLIPVFAALEGATKTVGLARCKANKKPEFKADQNKFRTGELEFKVASATSSTNQLMIARRYENVSDVPDFTDQADFQAYFAELFS